MMIDNYLYLAQEGIRVAVYVSAPMLLLGLIAGLVISIFQAATQINDASVAFIPKISAVIFGLFVFGHFMLTKLAEFMTVVYSQISYVGVQ
jgi:flagellar biosynthesis protein FliQ